MSAYLIIEGTVTDAAKWSEYSKAVVPLIVRFGGRHLNKPSDVTLLEGTHNNDIVALFEFPTMESIEAFWHSPEYVPVKQLRQNAATLEIRAVPGA